MALIHDAAVHIFLTVDGGVGVGVQGSYSGTVAHIVHFADGSADIIEFVQGFRPVQQYVRVADEGDVYLGIVGQCFCAFTHELAVQVVHFGVCVRLDVLRTSSSRTVGKTHDVGQCLSFDAAYKGRIRSDDGESEARVAVGISGFDPLFIAGILVLGHVGSRRFGVGTFGSIDFVAQEVDLAGVRAHGAVTGDNVVPVERASVYICIRVDMVRVRTKSIPS